jgi:DNA polymerase III alpha subunit
MAMFLALVRPAKRHLLDKSWGEIAEGIWDKPNDGSYYFKKAHAVSYAMLVALHMNILG